MEGRATKAHTVLLKAMLAATETAAALRALVAAAAVLDRQALPSRLLLAAVSVHTVNGGSGTTSFITGSAVARAGGGGGGVSFNGYQGQGGAGGGGIGGIPNGSAGSGTVNTGSGKVAERG